jgi:hypothetical protein
MKRPFAPAGDRADQGQIIGGQRRVVIHRRHRFGPAIPVYRDPVKVQRMTLNPACAPDEQRVVDVNGFVDER